MDLTIHHVCGIDELTAAPLGDASRIVSILVPDGAVPPELVGIEKPILFLRFHDAIAGDVDFVFPTDDGIRTLLAFDRDATDEERLVVHCTAGVSRSTAALVILLAQRHPGNDDAIFAGLRNLRPHAWPNSFTIEIADRLLERNGSLIAALRRHYIVQAQRYPNIVRRMLALGQHRGPG